MEARVEDLLFVLGFDLVFCLCAERIGVGSNPPLTLSPPTSPLPSTRRSSGGGEM